MNRYITYTARAKLRNIINSTEDTKAINLTAKNGGFEIAHVTEEIMDGSILICSNPRIFTDRYTLSLLKTASVDFSYNLNEFIISRDLNELFTYS